MIYSCDYLFICEILNTLELHTHTVHLVLKSVMNNPSLHDGQLDCLYNAIQMDEHPLNLFTFSIFNFDYFSRAQVHSRAIRCGVGHRLQCDPAVPHPRSSWPPGHLEERGWTSPFQQASRTWHYYTEQGGSTYQQWVFLVGYMGTHYT